MTLRLLASHSTDMAEVSLSKGINYLKHEDDILFASVLTTVGNGKVTKKAQAASRQHSRVQVVAVQYFLNFEKPTWVSTRVINHTRRNMSSPRKLDLRNKDKRCATEKSRHVFAQVERTRRGTLARILCDRISRHVTCPSREFLTCNLMMTKIP